MLHPAPARRVERHGARASRAHGHGDSGGILLRAVARATKRICNTTAAARSVVAERSLRVAGLVPVADGIGAYRDAQRARFGLESSGGGGPSPPRQAMPDLQEDASTRKERRACRERPEGDGVLRDNDPRGWTVNEIPSTRGHYQLLDRDRTVGY